MSTRRAEVAGAGLAGLTVASVLAQRGWSVRVHERGEDLREIGAGIYLWENALKVLEAIGAYDVVTSTAERIYRPELRDHRHRVLQTEWLRDGRLYTVARRHLHRSLADTAISSGVEIVTSSPVARASAEGWLETEDSVRWDADLVVGADGFGSLVRESLGLTKSVVNLHDGCGRHLIPRTSDDPHDGRTIEEWNGGRRMGVVPCHPDWTYIFLCCPDSDVEGTQQSPFNRSTWQKSFPHLKSQLDRIPDFPEGSYHTFHDVQSVAWHKGRAAILGDAAHGMSPNLGQAACCAMMNALALGQALDRYDVETALDVWETSERPVTESVQKYSRLYGRIGTSWPRSLLDVRSALVWGLGRFRPVQRRVNFAASYHPTLDQPETASHP
ncbi:MAG: NAD(P)/FAD-dependent oxidoreductase [Actinomycetota bacterium]|nr:NAD(P)/FAD-dependent oxidoreductase [Actinomycetota bacterium]